MQDPMQNAERQSKPNAPVARFLSFAAAAFAVLVLGAGAAYARFGKDGSPPPEIAANANGWPAHNYDLSNTRADTHSAIDAANVSTLKPKWTFKLTDTSEFGAYTTNALVVGGVVYFESPKANVYALSESTGRLIWEHKYNTAIPSGGPTGLAIGYGMIFGSTARAAFALKLSSGAQVWMHTLSQNSNEGIDSAPQVYDGKVLISTIPGSATNYYLGGAYGILYSLDATTGATVWSFSTVAGGSKLWGDPGENGGGGLWYPPAVDSAGRVFFGTGNPSPVYSTKSDPNAKSRPGPDLYTDSLVAVNGATGKLLWYHQVTPHDVRDYDFQDPPIVTMQKIDGVSTEVVIGAGKSGKVMAFRASDGKPLWLLNIGEHNNNEYGPLPAKPVLVCPGSLGGVLTPMAYSAGVVYVPWVDLCLDQSVTETPTAPPKVSDTGGLAAVDAATGRIIWSHRFDILDSGAATIANNVVFTSDFTGKLYAFSTKTGSVLWSAQAPGNINGFPAVSKNMLIVGTGAPSKGANSKAELVAYALGGA
jgi:alcohol dehydrogenase (cytochrome c)